MSYEEKILECVRERDKHKWSDRIISSDIKKIVDEIKEEAYNAGYTEGSRDDFGDDEEWK